MDPFEVDGELVEIVGPRAFKVKSQSQEELWYAVDAEAGRCTCRGFEIRKECRHLSAVLAFVAGQGETAADVPLVAFELCTSRYQNADLILEAGALPVRITLGHPRFKLRYTLAGTVMALAPKGLKDVESDEEFDRLYRERLDSFGVEKLRRAFSDIAAPHSGEGSTPLLALLCYEDLTKPGESCHRRNFAAWWEERTGQKVEELGGPIAESLDMAAA